MILPPGEKIIETKKCLLSSKDFFVTDKDLEFYDKVSPIFGGRKYNIPSPTLCPEERMKNLMCFRNQGSLHKRKNSIDNQDCISIYTNNTSFPVYKQEYWWSDAWDAKMYVGNFDNNSSLFYTFSKLKSQVPRPHTNVKNSENCEFTNYMIDSKDCYLSFASSWSEKTHYSAWTNHAYSAMDCTACDEVKNSYELVQCNTCDSCNFCVNCVNTSDSWFSYSLSNCHHCLFCSNLRGKEYYCYNKKISPEEYDILVQKIKDNYSSSQDLYKERLQKNTIRRATQNTHCENVLGEYLYSCKNNFFCYQQHGVEDCRYCWGGFFGQKNCMDCCGSSGELCYMSGLPFQSYGINFSEACAFSRNVNYSDFCMGVNDCFACVGLHSHEHHCILNKPYSVQEYEILCGKIIDHMRSTGEWGEFFPHELSPFGYNETVAQEYFPMTKEEVLKMPRFHEGRFGGSQAPLSRGVPRDEAEGLTPGSETPRSTTTPLDRGATGTRGWNWYNEPVKTFEGASIQPLPIGEYDERKVGFETAQKNIDTLLNGMLVCEVTRKPFKIIRQELAFYIENSLPIPTKHPDQRHTERMALRNPRTLFERTCNECGRDIVTTYASERPEKVVCEECYRRLVY